MHNHCVAHHFAVVDVERVKAVVDERRLSLERHLVLGSALDRAHRSRLARDVRVAEEGERDLLRVARLECAVERHDVEDLLHADIVALLVLLQQLCECRVDGGLDHLDGRRARGWRFLFLLAFALSFLLFSLCVLALSQLVALAHSSDLLRGNVLTKPQQEVQG